MNARWSPSNGDDNGIPQKAGEQLVAVYCGRLSVDGKEYYDAAQQGLHPEIVLAVYREEYGGQHYVDFDGRRYTIYRPYERTDGLIELYCTQKVGDRR